MRLYFFRHAQAEPALSYDFERRLTPRGRTRTQTASRVMAALGVRPTTIYTSPRVRAHETAEIIAETLLAPLLVDEGLDFGFDLAVVERLVSELDDEEELVFVGHEPSMSHVLGTMTGGEIVMKKGGLARLDITFFAYPLTGELVWLIAPKVFDVLGQDL